MNEHFKSCSSFKVMNKIQNIVCDATFINIVFYIVWIFSFALDSNIVRFGMQKFSGIREIFRFNRDRIFAINGRIPILLTEGEHRAEYRSDNEE